MSKGMIGKKLGMTSLFTSDGKLVPVTVLEVGPCVVTQIKTNEKDGYEVNNVFHIGTVKLNGDYTKLSDRQILKRLHNKPGNNIFPSGHITLKFDLRQISVDNGYMSEDTIFLTDKRGIKPMGEIRLEVIE